MTLKLHNNLLKAMGHEVNKVPVYDLPKSNTIAPWCTTAQEGILHVLFKHLETWL